MQTSNSSSSPVNALARLYVPIPDDLLILLASSLRCSSSFFCCSISLSRSFAFFSRSFSLSLSWRLNGSTTTLSESLMASRQNGHSALPISSQLVKQALQMRCPQGSMRMSLSFSAHILHSWNVEPISQ